MKLLVQGHPALVGSQTLGPSCFLLPCALFLKLAFHQVLSALPPTIFSIPVLLSDLIALPLFQASPP